MTQINYQPAMLNHVPLEVFYHEGRCFLRCHDVRSFLKTVSPEALPEFDRRLDGRTWVAGVIIPGDGAYFDLMDPMGVAAVEFLRLSDEIARDRIISNLQYGAH